AHGLLWRWPARAFRSVAQAARAQCWLPHWADEVAAAPRRLPADVLAAGCVVVGALVAAEAAGVPAGVRVPTVYPRLAPGRPRNGRLVGTPLEEAVPTPWAPPWSPAERQPRLLVSLSTLQQGQAPLMERLLTALAGLPVRALVTLGPALAAASWTPPPNVILE